MSRLLSLCGMLLLWGCSIEIQPAVAPLAARMWSFAKGDSWEAIRERTLRIAPTLGYQVSEQPAGILLQSGEIFAHEIDQYCVYPIINAKTGTRLHTFATWQMEMRNSANLSGRAVAVVTVEISKADRPPRAKSYCRAFTQMDVQPADSLGTYERALLLALGAEAQ